MVPNESTGVIDANIVKWKVGSSSRSKIVSKGIKATVKLPVLKDDDMSDLLRRQDVDSWIISVRKEGIVARSILDYLYIPVARVEGQRQYRALKQLDTFAVNIFYSVVAASRRLGNLQCPALGHNKVLKDLKIKERKTFNSSVSVSRSGESVMDTKVSRFALHPHTINAGKSLEGRYVFEAAMYNSRTGRVFSNWLKLDGELEVPSEKSIVLKSCRNFRLGREHDYDPVGR